MPEKELDLFELASGLVAQPGAGSTEIVGRDRPEVAEFRLRRRSDELFALLGGEPVVDSNPESLGSLHPTDAGGRVETKEAAIRALVCQLAHCGKPEIDRRRGVPALFQGDSILSDNGLLNDKPWL